MEFLQYVSKHGKSYGTKEEFQLRSDIFKKTMQYIDLENQKQSNTFRLGINKFADWTDDEFNQLLGQKPLRSDLNVHGPILSAETLPQSVDWRYKGAVSPVMNEDEKTCGSCWAISAVGAMEGAYKIKNGTLYRLSVQQLVDCNSDFSGCNGGDMSEGIEYAVLKGMVSESSYPYVGIEQQCKLDNSSVIVSQPLKAVKVTPNSILALKSAISFGPVSVGIEAVSNVFKFYSGGILNSLECGKNINHGALAIGYGADLYGRPYYIVKNSWGTNWGVNGYVNIAITNDGDGVCGIQIMPVYAEY